MTNDNAPAVASICQQLDGIPLAIELAAARVRVVTVDQIAQGLSDRFRLLSGGARTALPRQQTLLASVDWSHDLLTERERHLLRRLSAFTGGFTLDADEEVGESADIHRYDVLDILSALADKSLVVPLDDGGAGRYMMLETIRQYARDRAEQAGEWESIRDRHARFYERFSADAAARLTGPDQVEWFERLAQEHDNVRAVLEWTAGS